MKKTHLFFLSVASAIFLSSCFLIATPEDKEKNAKKPPELYSVTCYNKTDIRITDWCVKNLKTKITYPIYEDEDDIECFIIKAGESETINNLPAGTEYKLYIAFVENPDVDDYDYWDVGPFELKENISYYVNKIDIPLQYQRSATLGETTECKYVVITSDGQQIELKRCKNSEIIR